MNKDTVQYLADLARLSISEDEQLTIAHDLESIIGLVDQIQKITIDKNNAVVTDTNVFRDDVVAPLRAVHDLVDATPLHQDGYVKVPKVLE